MIPKEEKEALEGLSLSPVNFFSVDVDCHRLPPVVSSLMLSDRYLLPDQGELCGEESFASVAVGWSSEEIVVSMHSKLPLQDSSYSKVEKRDSLEVFIDTRDLKSVKIPTRFCHHFICLPEEDVQAAEVTHFRSEEDSHVLCDPRLLLVSVEKTKKSYTMQLRIPMDCLHGYDPDQFDRLGFTYRINRVGDTPQHFSVNSKEYAIDQSPSLWGSLRLVS